MEDEEQMYMSNEESLFQQEIARLCNYVNETGQLWEDKEFGADDKALYMDPMDPPEYAADIP